MYSFEDRGGDSLTLRPELTAGIARAYLTEGWQQHIPLKVTSWGPAFRYERPQKGRFRQFHQIGVELLGVATPQADIEVIALGDGMRGDVLVPAIEWRAGATYRQITRPGPRWPTRRLRAPPKLPTLRACLWSADGSPGPSRAGVY